MARCFLNAIRFLGICALCLISLPFLLIVTAQTLVLEQSEKKKLPLIPIDGGQMFCPCCAAITECWNNGEYWKLTYNGVNITGYARLSFCKRCYCAMLNADDACSLTYAVNYSLGGGFNDQKNVPPQQMEEMMGQQLGFCKVKV